MPYLFIFQPNRITFVHKIIIMKPNWKGVYPAITTKFKPNGELDIDLNVKGFNAQLEAGVDGIILSGSLGEASTITEAEKETLLKEALKTIGDKVPVLLNIAEGSTDEAVRQAKLAEK